MAKLNTLQLLLAGSVCGLAVAAHAAVTNPGFNQGADGLAGWGSGYYDGVNHAWVSPAVYTYLGGSTYTLPSSVTSATAQPILSGGQVPTPPNATPTFLQLLAGPNVYPNNYVTVYQRVTLTAGETISGDAALSAFDIYGNDSARVVLSGPGGGVVWSANNGVTYQHDANGNLILDGNGNPILNNTFSGWQQWSFKSANGGTYTLKFQVASDYWDGYTPPNTDPTEFKYSSDAYFTVNAVPEPTTWVAGGAAVLFTLMAFGRGRGPVFAEVKR